MLGEDRLHFEGRGETALVGCLEPSIDTGELRRFWLIEVLQLGLDLESERG
jgi:hypothetical protein